MGVRVLWVFCVELWVAWRCDGSCVVLCCIAGMFACSRPWRGAVWGCVAVCVGGRDVI